MAASISQRTGWCSCCRPASATFGRNGRSGGRAASPCRCRRPRPRPSGTTSSPTRAQRSSSETEPRRRCTSMASARGARFVDAGALGESGRAPQPLPEIDRDRGAMILYTSGTTSRPKGVVTTHRQSRGADSHAGRRLGVDGRRSHPARPPAQPRPRHRQHPRMRDVGRGGVRVPLAVRADRGLGPAGPRRSDAVHGRADHLRPAAGGVGGGRRGPARAMVARPRAACA